MAAEPGPAALDFLGKLKAGEVDFSPGGDTALQANTSQAKREQIRKRLERVGMDLAEGTLELGEIRQDGDYAGVLVRKIGSYDSSNMNVIPIALVRNDGKWVPAPVVASFENAVTGYTMQLKERLETLEMWMLRQRVVDLERIISQSGERMRTEIREHFPAEGNREEDPGRVVMEFIKACAGRNQAAVLGYLGGLEEKKPEDWVERVASSSRAVAGNSETKLPWRLVVSPAVIREVVYSDRAGDRASVSVACLDPALVSKHGGPGEIQLLHFDLDRSESGQWVIELPDALLFGETDELDADEKLDVDLLNRFTRKLREADGARGSETLEDAEQKVMVALRSGSLRELLSRVDFQGKPKEARMAVRDAAAVWWSANDATNFRIPVRLGSKKEGRLGMACYQWFALNYADRFDLRTFSFKETEAGWMWVPGVYSEVEGEDQGVLNEWMKSSTRDWKRSWREELMKASVRIEAGGDPKLATDKEVGELLADWNSRVEKGDFKGALALTAWLGGEDAVPMHALRNIGHEFEDFEKTGRKLGKIYRGKFWVVAGISKRTETATYHSLVPVVVTAEGSRLLPEIDLIVGEDRTRRFLNELSFTRLAAVYEKRRVSELEQIFSEFSEEVMRK